MVGPTSHVTTSRVTTDKASDGRTRECPRWRSIASGGKGRRSGGRRAL